MSSEIDTTDSIGLVLPEGDGAQDAMPSATRLTRNNVPAKARKDRKAIANEEQEIVSYILAKGPTPRLELAVRLNIPVARVEKKLLNAYMTKKLEVASPPYEALPASAFPVEVKSTLQCREDAIIRIEGDQSEVKLSIIVM